MFLTPILRPSKVISINSTANDYNLFTESGNPYYPLNVICQINAVLNGTSSSNPAFQTGSGWTRGSWILIRNNNTLNGFDGLDGSSGAGGSGGNAFSVGNGSSGGNGNNGDNGGIGLSVNSLTGVSVSLDNASGTINGGIGGIGGIGGGGGGGAGSYDYNEVIDPETGQVTNTYTFIGGGGGGGAGTPFGVGGNGSPSGSDGTATLGGAGGNSSAGDGGNGGNLGLAGQNGQPFDTPGGSGGLAGADGADGTDGAAISGYSLLNIIALGTVNGSTV